MTEPTGPDEPAPSEPAPAAPEWPAESELDAPIWSAPAGVAVASPPPSTGMSRRTWIVGLVAAVALIGMAASCALGALFLYKRSQASPKEVVEQYLTATRDQNGDVLDGITCESLQTGRGEYSEFGSGVTPDNKEFFQGISWKIGADKEIADDRHEVTADVSLKAGTKPGSVKLTFLVVKENGWKICGLAD